MGSFSDKFEFSFTEMGGLRLITENSIATSGVEVGMKEEERAQLKGGEEDGGGRINVRRTTSDPYLLGFGSRSPKKGPGFSGARRKLWESSRSAAVSRGSAIKE